MLFRLDQKYEPYFVYIARVLFLLDFVMLYAVNQ